MISIREKVAELEKWHELRQKTLDCYAGAIQSAAQYAVEIDSDITPAHRAHLSAIEGRLRVSAELEDLEYSRGALRNELRDYRDKAASRLNALCRDLETNAKTLQEILTAMSADGDDHEVRLRQQVKRLRAIARQAEAASIRDALEAATSALEECVEQIRSQNQLTVAQFLVEVQMLHQRIEGLQAAASIDELSRLYNRRETEARIRSAVHSGAPFCLALLKLHNLDALARQYSEHVVGEAVAAFSKRLRNQLPKDATTGRWGASEFVAILPVEKSAGLAATRQLAQYLSGTYVCMEDGSPHRVSLQAIVGVVDSPQGEDPRRVIERVSEFLSGS